MKPVTIVWSDRAVKNLVQIKEYISRDKPQAAISFIKRIKKSVERLSRLPLSGRQVPEMQGSGVREIIVGQYRIVYRQSKKSIVILTVFPSCQIFRTASSSDL